jgi:hypothetical protein
MSPTDRVRASVRDSVRGAKAFPPGAIEAVRKVVSS